MLGESVIYNWMVASYVNDNQRVLLAGGCEGADWSQGYPKIPLKGKNSSYQEWLRTKLVLGPWVVDLPASNRLLLANSEGLLLKIPW